MAYRIWGSNRAAVQKSGSRTNWGAARLSKCCADRPKQRQGRAEWLEEPRHSEKRRKPSMHGKATKHAKARKQLKRGSDGGEIRSKTPDIRRQKSDTESTIPDTRCGVSVDTQQDT